MRIVTSNEMYGVEETAERKGVSRGIMMENAGKNIVEELVKLFPDVKKKKICILCGKGNNGGDGLVAARYLSNLGVVPDVSVLGKLKEVSPLSKQNLARLKKLKVSVHETTRVSDLAKRIKRSDIVIDAIFGTGFKGSAKGFIADVIDSLLKLTFTECGKKPVVISVDLPTGVNADTGEISVPCVKADWTFTLGLPKKGLLLFPGAEYVGKLKVLDIGIPSSTTAGNSSLNFITREDICHFLLPRRIDAHKGTYGHTFILAGSAGMTGAATLTSLGALYSGAGLVTTGVPESLNHIMEIKLTEVMTKPLPETKFQSLSFSGYKKIFDFSRIVDVLAVGPGLSRIDETLNLVRRVIGSINLPMVIDADAIFALKGHTSILKKRKAPTVLMPHPGEMVYLTGKPVDVIQADRIKVARDFALRFAVSLVLKGARTVVASPSGEVWINSTGNPGMASGGVGDVLTGIIASLIGQKINAFEAAKIGVYVHGLAGDLSRDKNGEIGLTASDVINELPHAFKKL